MTLRTTIILTSLLALIAARLAYDGYFYATGHDLPGLWDTAMTLWLFATCLINPVQPDQRLPVSGFWLTAIIALIGVLTLFVALFWLVQHTELGSALDRSQVKRALRIAEDAAYVVAAAIMLVGWWRNRHAPPGLPLAEPQP